MASIGGNALKTALETAAQAKAGREAAQHLTHLSTPADARAANRTMERRLAAALDRRGAKLAVAPHVGQVSALAVAMRNAEERKRQASGR